MPIREYQATDPNRSCSSCRQPFEQIESVNQPPVEKCPQCGAAVVRLISAPAVGASRTGFDDRAKSAGFHKLKKLGRGEYEKKY
ncbi:MAG: zinc ribbon domain-containing protein [Verrucomicrobia bacterium]|nr:zinc ribbon domain-containing protein [Verrucomicrobiota bacterium]MCG2680510.1 zinc ribbon domain-containing protein [Kiritimatiellia bacterium]MBU4248233.1 zinc ribbon domain-containing protein [Verrucomicrobiota bacterium]MBU4290436.1 zinc ribbon domain-containing protein [Verrucomicrobiota bacterium]MBU4430157.1 zinc ribbon domain-containing protein [Verrucomicrobiota bacterium]